MAGDFPVRRERAVADAQRRRLVQGVLLGAAAFAAGGCGPAAQPPLAIGAQPWPGYELLFLARELAFMDPAAVRLIEAPSASATVRALASGVIDGAGLTLDEVLAVRENGVPLAVIAVIDISSGADALLLPGDAIGPGAIRGLRIGVEQSAVGAVMLAAVLEAAELTVADVDIVYVPVDEHEQAVADGRVSGVVTYEPVKSRLLKRGLRVVYSSAQVPGRIMDVLAIRSDVAARNPRAVLELVDGYFRARSAWLGAPARHAGSMARRLGLAPEEVPGAFAEIELPDLSENRVWLQGERPRLADAAAALGRVMVDAGLLRAPPDLAGLADGHFL